MTKLLFTILLLAGVACAADAPPGFDPARHMRVSEVREGMSGYGLSVFQGTRIERFEVRVLSVLRNFNPQSDVVLVQCRGANLEHTGSIAGMSGSPVYLRDDSGRERLIGAFAYGWPMMKDPVGGVQPIEYMLRLPTEPPATRPATQMAGTWRVDQTLARVQLSLSRKPREQEQGLARERRLMPLRTPMMVSGLGASTLRDLAPLWESEGLTALQGGGGSTPATQPVRLEPGSVMAVPILTGDVDMTAVGTCTEVIGDRIYGFGHPFTNEGDISLPVGPGRIHAVIANLMTSFKLGSISQVSGTAVSDATYGVAGRLGAAPATVPIELTVDRGDGRGPTRYRFNCMAHPRFTALASVVALAAAVTGPGELPQYHTLEYDLGIEFRNGRSIRLANTLVNSAGMELMVEVGGPLLAVGENPFERVLPAAIHGTVRITPEARDAEILSVNAPREKLRPGETVNLFVRYRPFRGAEDVLKLELELPRDLPEGGYQLSVCDAQRFLAEERTVRPFRFTAQSSADVFAVLHDLAAIRRDALYLRLLRQGDGVAMGRTALPHLPSSRRRVLLGAGRSDTTAFISSTVKVVPTRLVMNGEARFMLTVDKDAKVEPPRPRGDGREGREPGQARPRSENPPMDMP